MSETITCPCIRKEIHKPFRKNPKTGQMLCVWCTATVELFGEGVQQELLKAYTSRVRELLASEQGDAS